MSAHLPDQEEPMKILAACEESQAVTIELRRLGHEAYSCDIIPCSGGHPEWHIQCNVLPLLNGRCEFRTCDGKDHTVNGRWDMIIAFPPCTYLTAASAVRLFNSDGTVKDFRRFEKGEKAAAFFRSFLNADCHHIAVENPVQTETQAYTIVIYFIPTATPSEGQKPSQVLREPWQSNGLGCARIANVNRLHVITRSNRPG